LSYVIQNFNNINKKINLTPRIKFLILLNNLDKFLIFFKFNTFLNSFLKNNIFQINYLNFFIKYFFSKQLIKFAYNFNLDFTGNYTNNLIKSYVYFFYFNINNFLKSNLNNFFFYNFSTNFIYNIYYFPIKTLNIKINSFFYKNIFFYFMLINPFLWYQHTSSLRFYLNFIFINYNLKIFRFYNGYFLRIYNH
jgi:hypothetical protein